MQIVKVRYLLNTESELSSREYTYFSEDPLKVGDIVTVPVRDTTSKAQVSAVDVPETEIASFKDKVKTIPVGAAVKPTLKTGKEIAEKMPVINDPLITQALRNREIESGELHGDDMIPPSPHLSQPDTDMQTSIAEVELVRVNPTNDSVYLSLHEQALSVLKYAEDRVILTDADLTPATNDLSIISKVKKAIEEKRQEWVMPIREILDKVNLAFKTLSEPIEKADKLTRDKILTYRADQEKKRREAEEINRQKEELARREAALNGTGEVTGNTTPVIVPEPTVAKVKTDLGTAGTVRTRKARVVNFALLPDTYKLPNEKLLAMAAKTGVHEIPGVQFFHEETLRVTTR